MRRFSLFSVGGLFTLFVLGTSVSTALAVTEKCEGDVKTESSGPTTYTNADGIFSVCIKAGTQTYTFYCGEETKKDDCYTVDWEEDSKGVCTEVTISGGGTSRYCKDISNTTSTFDEKK